MLRTDRDAVLCFLWMLTYTLVLIGTERYKYPLISPITQILIASLEFSVVFQLILDGGIGWNHIWISYLYWALIEAAIIGVQIKRGFIPKHHVGGYLFLLATATMIMCYLVAYKGHGFFLSYFNTFVGEIIWLVHIRKKDYPMKPIALLLFSTKFAADAIGISIYFGRGSWMTDLISVLLPVLDFMFIHIYCLRAAGDNQSNHKQNKTNKEGKQLK